MTVAIESKPTASIPYAPFATVKAFFEKVDPIPATLDRSVLRYTSGSVQNVLMSSLRALGLIDDSGRVIKDNMSAIASGFKSGDKAILQKALQARLRAVYPSLFDGTFEIESATQAQLRSEFERLSGGTGDTVRKAIGFFLSACEEAGIEYSPHFKMRGGFTRRSSGANGSVQKKTKTKGETGTDSKRNPPAQDTGIEGVPVPIASVLQRLPGDGEEWTLADKKRFLAALEVMLDLCYTITDESAK